MVNFNGTKTCVRFLWINYKPGSELDWCVEYGKYVNQQVTSTPEYQSQSAIVENSVKGLPNWLKQTPVW